MPREMEGRACQQLIFRRFLSMLMLLLLADRLHESTERAVHLSLLSFIHLYFPFLSARPHPRSSSPRPELVGRQFREVLFMFDDAVPCGIQRNATHTSSSLPSSEDHRFTSSLRSPSSPSSAAKHIIINPPPDTVLQVYRAAGARRSRCLSLSLHHLSS